MYMTVSLPVGWTVLIECRTIHVMLRPTVSLSRSHTIERLPLRTIHVTAVDPLSSVFIVVVCVENISRLFSLWLRQVQAECVSSRSLSVNKLFHARAPLYLATLCVI